MKILTHTDLASTAPANAGHEPRVRHGFFTRHGGVSEGRYASLNCGLGSDDDAEAVHENRRRAAAKLGLDDSVLCTGWQVHSASALIIEAPFETNDRPRVDALVTRTPGIALGVLTADCAPVLLADHEAGVIAAAHAGWRGALDGILDATAGAMEQLGSTPANIAAVIGPTIGPASYEVGPAFPAPFIERDPADERFFTPASRAGHWMFDLPGYVSSRLVALGLGSVAVLNHDTYTSEEDFFSYRRTCHNAGGDYGRLLSAIALEA